MTSNEVVGYSPLPAAFYQREVLTVARELLGKALVTEAPQGRCVGIIVETEAYRQDDPASHSYPGPTQRNRTMFQAGGKLYVYRSYGIHWCCNVVADRKDFGAAVLIRALQPIEGLELMRHRRETTGTVRQSRHLASGPGRVCAALGLHGEHDGLSLLQGRHVWISTAQHTAQHHDRAGYEIKCTPRIGITKAVDAPWRFCWAHNPHVSGPKRWR